MQRIHTVILFGVIVLTGLVILVGIPQSTSVPVSDTPQEQTAVPTSEAAEMAETPAAPVQETHTVTYRGDGFSPAAMEIQTGETVTFVNASSHGMWVASADHPTHTRYPEKTAADCKGSAFDQCTASAAGTSWSFTFNQAGSWIYHNHTQASHRGTIIVHE